MENTIDLVGAFSKGDVSGVRSRLRQNPDISDLEDYLKTHGGGKLSMLQGWVLQEIYGVKNHGYGIYELNIGRVKQR